MPNNNKTSKNGKGLGKGIDAIFSDFEGQNVDATEENVLDLRISEIRPNPYQPREEFDEDALQDLANSIKENGVFQPIIVRQSVNGYEIIAGERRFRASKIADKKTIPAIVRDLDERQMLEIAVLENLQREDLSPIEEAEAYDTLIKKLNITQEEVSKRLGKSRPYIANYLRLLNLPPMSKKYLKQGKLSMGQARTLLGLQDKEKIDYIAKMVVQKGITVRELEKIVAEANNAKPRSLKRVAPKSPFVKASVEELISKFDTQVDISENKDGHGKIQIDFKSTDDLNRILDILGISID
ncbi:ParB/RepB/Spo0J family partition protein [Lactobacillus sp. YT155]|uniref:ParB/RepB/Spo0J family partition protein n=1 Tax=Lactobacillus sp. YT155 TaxID=3060955 RepID=UPI00265F7035|nr:ParB/RepB/Spo0J family partition protein [Lactobacillus sp. YT155]MDO1604954.1 ParB/RepB/Spo0J family partition protein [Lactobacillus sp. YT155]